MHVAVEEGIRKSSQNRLERLRDFRELYSPRESGAVAPRDRINNLGDVYVQGERHEVGHGGSRGRIGGCQDLKPLESDISDLKAQVARLPSDMQATKASADKPASEPQSANQTASLPTVSLVHEVSFRDSFANAHQYSSACAPTGLALLPASALGAGSACLASADRSMSGENDACLSAK